MDDYDVVIDALQKHRDRLWDMTNRNMNSEYAPLNIMDEIRLFEQLDAAIAARKNKKEWVGLTDEERLGCEISSNNNWRKHSLLVEAKLKEKNSG
jgi:hypothetical protein